jgi:hypothetical protein
MLLVAPSAVGDVLDRITILTLKLERVGASQGANVSAELSALRAAWAAGALPAPEEVPEFVLLGQVNRELWDVEDRLRAAEAAGRFDDAFVQDARTVYRVNDRRAALKRSVNLRYGSAIVEEKLHPGYGEGHG